MGDGIQTRAVTSVYGTFIISWLLLHWLFIYTVLFVSEQLIYTQTGLLKNVYLVQTFFNLNDWYFYVSWAAPFLLTWLVIWKLPKWILIPAFEKDEEYRVEKLKTRIRLDKQVEVQEISLAVEKDKKLAVQEKRATRKKRIEEKTPEVLWDEEYKAFELSSLYPQFDLILKSVYENAGKIVDYDDYNQVTFQIPRELLAYAHTSDLVTLDKDKEKIELTEKGKYFVAQYSKRLDF